jgi:hypothetical protein
MELHLASPEHLSAIISERLAAGKPIREEMLLKVMWRGGHDVHPIIVKALKDPNALEVLIRRAKREEASVKEPLERIFQDKIGELEKTTTQIRENPNSIRSLITMSAWGDETAKRRLQRAFQDKLIELSERVRRQDNSDALRSELIMLLEIDSVLHRPSRVRQLIVDANMPELLEDTSRTETSEPELLTSLFEIAGALAFISDPQEALARFIRVLDLVAPRQDDRSRPDLNPSAGILLKTWAGNYRECLFYRSLAGVPKPQVTALLKDYLQRLRLADPFDQTEFLDVFYRAGDRELAEWVFQKVAESRPSVQVSDYPDLIPTFEPTNISDVKGTRVIKRSKDLTDRYLEPTFPYIGFELIPLLLEHLDSDNDQLRAFIVWRLTSLGYQWPREQIAALRKDSYWKVRLNVLFALDADELAMALDDQSAVVRVVAQMLMP